MIACLSLERPREGHFRLSDPCRRFRTKSAGRAWGHTHSPPNAKDNAMANNDPFSASVIPFEVPEQMRAFAEKGVSHARDSYAKFKDAAESHNGAIEAFFVNASKGASEYSAKMMEFVKSNTTANLDFTQQLFSIKSP